MKCPFCGHIEDKVIDSRSTKDGNSIRRRRECLKCEKRFTSYERVEDLMPMVIKKDGSREPFDRQKILKGLEKALHKRPVDVETRDRAVDEIEKKVLSLELKEVPSSAIGEELMSRLKDMDKIAYVRFASVYREFKDINEFMDELQGLLKTGSKRRPKASA
jgi:transcriptional repressor NrdR